MPGLSVIIAAKNEAATLGDQLDALTSQPWPNGGEIIVADNGSTDDTRLIARSRHSDSVPVLVVDCAEIAGAGYARNRGVECSAHDRIAFCDADDVVSSSWVRSVDAALDCHRVAGGPLDLSMLNERAVRGSRGQDFPDRLPRFHGQFPVLSSCNLAIERSVFEALGGFDVSFLRGQDAELSLRLHEEGIEAGFAPDMVVHYRLRTTTRAIFKQARGWGRVEPRLLQRLSERPPTSKPAQTLRSWAWLAARLPTLTTADGRARWAYVAGKRIGALEGSLGVGWLS